MDLSKYAKKSIDKPDFEKFWKSAIKSYRNAGCKPGNKDQALKKWIEFEFDQLAGMELARRINNNCEDRLAEIKDIGSSQYLPHIPTWLNQKEWAEEEERYIKFVAPEYVKKHFNDRPAPAEIQLVPHEQFTPEQRAKMQEGFNNQIKGVRKGV